MEGHDATARQVRERHEAIHKQSLLVDAILNFNFCAMSSQPKELRRKKIVCMDSPNEPKITESESTVKEAVIAGTKSAIIAGAVASVPVLLGCRKLPWAKANINHTGQALLISAASVSGFFISADKTILEKAKENSISKFDKA